MGGQYHVTEPIGYRGVRMGCGIVKQLLDLAPGIFCWDCLLNCDQAHGGKYCAVFLSRIVEECAAHLYYVLALDCTMLAVLGSIAT